MRKVSEHTTEFWQHLRNKNIYLACSGGVDSIVLLHLLHRLKVNLTVIHVNYQLRGSDSEADAQLVESVCDQLKIPFQIRKVRLKDQLEDGGNLQDKARKVRYDWFKEILADDSNNRIALAHHQDDQIETFWMNLARKSGVLGLACMLPEHNGIVRPLLDFSKAEIRSFARNSSILWREDRSNESNAYKRNRLRNAFIPFLAAEMPESNASVLLLVSQFQRAQKELEVKVQPIVELIREKNALSISKFESLTEWEQIELFRQLNISASFALRMDELTERGKKIALTHSEFDSIVRDEQQFTFLRNQSKNYQVVLEEVAELPLEFNKEQAYFDAAKINGKLQLRKWKTGDRISPIGMKGSQLISDIIKDAKIDANEKLKQLILHDDEHILWCVGLKISRKAVADTSTESILRCTVIVSKGEGSGDQ